MTKEDFPERILILTTNFHGADGISAVARQVVRALCPAGDSLPRVEVWSLTDSFPQTQEDYRDRIKFRLAAGSKLRFVTWGLRASLESSLQTLVIVLHIALAPVALPLVARGARLAVFMHGIEVWQKLNFLETAAVRRAEIVMANSHHTAARFKAANPAFAASEIKICYLGLAPLQDDMAAPSPNTRFALIVARIDSRERYKGHDLLIEIWPEVRKEVPDATLIVAGDGPDRKRLEHKAQREGLGDCVQFLGLVPREILARLYRDCAFFVMPSTGEGFGLVFVEAMQAGKACIGGVGAAAEVIENGVTGLVVNPKKPEQVLSAVVRLFRDPELALRMGSAGAERAAQNFTAQHFHDRLLRALGLEKLP